MDKQSAGGRGHCCLGSQFGRQFLKVRGALECFVQESRFVQGVGYVGLRLPRQADGLWEAVLEDSSGWMVLGSRDWLVMVSASLSKWVGMSGGSFGRQLWLMVLGSRDCLVVVTCPLLVMVSASPSKWVGMSMALKGMLLRAWVSDIMGGLFSIYGA